MSDVLEKMRQRQSAIRVQVEQLQEQIAALVRESDELETAIRVAMKYSEDAAPERKRIRLRFTDSAKTITATEPLVIEGYGAKKAAIVAFARKAIDENGPLNSRQLLDRLDAAGLNSVVSGPDSTTRMKNLSSILSRDDRFVSDKDAGGWIYKETAPQGGNQEGLL